MDYSTSTTTLDWIKAVLMDGLVLFLCIFPDFYKLCDKASFKLLSSSSTSHFPLALTLFLLSFLNKFISFAVIFIFLLDRYDVLSDTFREAPGWCCCCIIPLAINSPKFSPINKFSFPDYFFIWSWGGVILIKWCIGFVEEWETLGLFCGIIKGCW